MFFGQRKAQPDHHEDDEVLEDVIAERTLKLRDEEAPETPQRSRGRRRILITRLSHVEILAPTIPMPGAKHELKKFRAYRKRKEDGKHPTFNTRENIQHPTPNIQHPNAETAVEAARASWMLGVEC